MKKLLALLAAVVATLSASSSAYAVNWNVAAIRYTKTHTTFYNATNHPSGGLAAQLSRISRGVMSASITYTPVIASNNAISCNGTSQHDSEQLLIAGCNILRGSGTSLSSYQELWLQTPVTGRDDFPGCSLLTIFSEKATSPAVQSACGVTASTSLVFNIPGDGASDMSPDSLGNEYTFTLVHESLHTLPSPTPGTATVSHDGVIECTSGLVDWHNANCTAVEFEGQRTFLSYPNSNAWANKVTAQEPVEYQALAGWLPVGSGFPAILTIGLGSSGSQYTISASDTGTLTYPVGIHFPRPDGRALFVEFRANQYVGGCAVGHNGRGGTDAAPPCATVNVPGLYVWMVDLVGHYYEVVLPSPAATNYHGLRPLPLGSTCIEGTCLNVLSLGSTSGTAAVSNQP